MSRTYRKNHRWFWKYQGEFYTCRNVDRSIKGKSRKYKDGSWSRKIGLNWLEVWFLFHGSSFYEEVIVSDGDNMPSNFNHRGIKKMCHRIDRARYKQALYHNEDAHITPSFNPWDWD